jgi:hypothetical protein
MKAFFMSMSQLQDFISVRPQSLMKAYFSGDGDAFLAGCEGDMLRLKDMTSMLSRQQRKVSIMPLPYVVWLYVDKRSFRFSDFKGLDQRLRA